MTEKVSEPTAQGKDSLMKLAKTKIRIISNRVILLNLVHTGYLQFLAIFHNLTANGHRFFGQN